MAKEGLLKDNKTREVIYPVTLADSVKTNIVFIEQGDGGVKGRPGNYYKVNYIVDDMFIISIEDMGYKENSGTQVRSFTVNFTTGDVPNVMIMSYEGHTISYQQGFSIEPNTEYELNFLWNGEKWIVAYGIIE